MKLFFDQNLSYRLCAALADLFPETTQARLAGLEQSTDAQLWQLAKLNGYTIVSQDADFADMVALYGPPPKVIWIHVGNQPTKVIEKLIRERYEIIKTFVSDTESSCLEIF